MADSVQTFLAPRSRTPINQEGVRLWEQFEHQQIVTDAQTDLNEEKMNTGKIFHDKSTSTNLLNAETELALDKNTNVSDKDISPKDFVLKNWRERQLRAKHERARRRIINSVKEKFRDMQGQTNLDAYKDSYKDYNHKSIPKIVIAEDVEDTSNLNVNRGFESQLILDHVDGSFRVACCGVVGKVVGHARRFQGPGGALAQCRLAARCGRAAVTTGAEGGLRGTRTEVMPLPTREGLTTPRSARAPIGRRPSTLPHQRLKKEKAESPPEMDSPGSAGSDLRRQNEELRARLAGESADHKRRLDAYRRAQQGQAALVSRLQAKVLQYKQRCAELENQMAESTPRSEPSYHQPSKTCIALPAPVASSSSDTRRDERITDLETALRRLDEEKRKCEKLVLLCFCFSVLQYKQRCAELENQMAESTPRSEPSYHQPSKTCIALPAPVASSSSDTRRDERITDLETALRRLDEEKRKCEKLVSQNNLLREQLEESHQLNEALTNDLQKLTNDWEALRDEMAIKEDEWKDEEQAFNDYYSSEHNRLLSLWREVVAVKRFFSDLQTNTERGLYKVKNDFDSVTRDLVGTLSGYAITAYATQDIKPESHQQLPVTPSANVDTLRTELRDVTSQRDTATSELRERDARIQRLLGELQALEERCECAESLCSEANVMRSALEEVARALIHDSESDAPTRMHITSDRSPKRAVPQSANTTAS
ncbi:Rootletin [Papilio machaon]|uniref:Rootletin n=1 Tax=Papilio machaon TaxID=76193 RepID=A0A194R6L4_PAPMA|nr:Rootletin [Papilio machaon]